MMEFVCFAMVVMALMGGASSSRLPKPKECTGNQVWTWCGGCDATCSERNGMPRRCKMKCYHKCECPPDAPYLNDNGECVPEDKCPPQPDCRRELNEVYSDCHSACDKTCEDRARRPCESVYSCTGRCGCRFGHARNAANVCVAWSACSPLPTSQDSVVGYPQDSIIGYPQDFVIPGERKEPGR